MKNMRRVFVMALTVIVMVLFTACGKSIPIDFADAESFEAALNAGENLEGKVVQFTAGGFHPDSAMGYDVWAGEHLNFISSSHPNIAQGDTVVARATKIENVLGSWVIAYERVDNGEVDEHTRSFEGASVQNTSDESTATTDSNSTGSTGGATITVTDRTDSSNSAAGAGLKIEAIDADIVGFKSYFGPMVSAYVAFKNTSDYTIAIQEPCINYEDSNGKLLSTDTSARCVPEAIKPGQIGYLYSLWHDISGVDTSNGFTFKPDGKIVEATNYYEVGVSDVSANVDDIMGVKVIGRGTNNSGRNLSLAGVGAVLFNKEGKVIGFGLGIESFDNGQTKSFELSGDMMSENTNEADVDHVEVYIQGDSWF